jgi:AraC family transcriptional regulator of arabinose operon
VDSGDRTQQTISVAESLLHWYQSPTNDLDTLKNLMPQQVAAEVYCVRGVNFARFFQTYLESPEFGAIQQEFLEQWHPFSGRLTYAQAQALLLSHAQLSDHELLYRGDIAVGQTRAQQSRPASDHTTAYHAGRTAWTLHMTTEGIGDYVAGTEIRSTPGELLLLSPLSSLHFKRSEIAREWSHYWAFFEPPASWLDLLDWPLCTYGVYRLKIGKEDDRRTLQNLLEEMVSLAESSDRFPQRLLFNLLEQFFIRAHLAHVETGTAQTDARVSAACEFMEQHIGESVSVADVAAHCNLSESRLAHLFKTHLGQSVKTFQDALRVQQAKRLLATTQFSISRIGEHVGYSDAAQFSKFFRRSMKCSPRTFRQEFTQTPPKGHPRSATSTFSAT